MSLGCPNGDSVATPTITIGEGQEANNFDFSQPITFTSTTDGATFHYTTDGTTAPTPTSPSGTTLTLSSLGNATEYTVKVIALKEGFTNSAVATTQFTKKATVASPTHSPAERPLATGETQTITLTASTGAILHYTTNNTAPVVGGTDTIKYENSFTMGSPVEIAGSYDDERPVQEITLSGFWMSQHEVTQKQWTDLMTNWPNSNDVPSITYGVGDTHPTYYVSWFDTLEYCNKLSEQEGLEACYTIIKDTPTSTDQTKWSATCDFTKKGYRLPTEAEWE